jgi:hypothetical protein
MIPSLPVWLFILIMYGISYIGVVDNKLDDIRLWVIITLDKFGWLPITLFIKSVLECQMCFSFWSSLIIGVIVYGLTIYIIPYALAVYGFVSMINEICESLKGE